MNTMVKTSINLHIDSDLLDNLKIYATQTECSVVELIERFCQQGLEMAQEGAIPDLDARLNSKDNLSARVGAIETEAKSILERLSVLESKVDVDIDVNDYLQNWQKSLELKIASLVDIFVEKRVEEILRATHRLAEIEQSQEVAPASEVKPSLTSATSKELLDDYQVDSDYYDDEPDEILTDFLEP